MLCQFRRKNFISKNKVNDTINCIYKFKMILILISFNMMISTYFRIRKFNFIKAKTKIFLMSLILMKYLKIKLSFSIKKKFKSKLIIILLTQIFSTAKMKGGLTSQHIILINLYWNKELNHLFDKIYRANNFFWSTWLLNYIHQHCQT